MIRMNRRSVLLSSLGAMLAMAPAHRVLARPYDDVLKAGRIVIFVYADNPPWSFRKDGNMVGIDVDIAREIAEGLGVDLELLVRQADENVDDDLRVNVWKGDIVGRKAADIMLHVPYDVEYACRFDQVVFTGQYAVERLAIAYGTADYPEKGPVPAVFRFDPLGRGDQRRATVGR